MADTPNHGYNVPDQGDEDWHVPLNENFEDYDTDIELRDEESNLSNYDPKAGAKFLATDTEAVYIGDGSDWNQLETSGDSPDLVSPSLTGTLTVDDIGTNGNPLIVDTGSTSVDGITTTILMGHPDNVALAVGGVIAGGGASGDGNSAGGECPTVSGGRDNTATTNYSTVAGGRGNTADAEYSAVLGGRDNTASGAYSVTAGRNAISDENDGTFVWGDSTTNQVDAIEQNSVVFQTGGSRDSGPAMEVFSQSDTSFASGVVLDAGDGSWSNLCSASVKTNVRGVDTASALEKVESMEINKWEYETQSGVDHVGPMAEEFNEAFGLGADEERISTVDANGVALAAIQGLSARIDDLEAENEELRERLDTIENHVDVPSTEDGG